MDYIRMHINAKVLMFLIIWLWFILGAIWFFTATYFLCCSWVFITSRRKGLFRRSE